MFLLGLRCFLRSLSVSLTLLKQMLIFFFRHFMHRDASYSVEHGNKRINPVHYCKRNIRTVYTKK